AAVLWNLVKELMWGHGLANSVAILLNRGAGDSVYFIQRFAGPIGFFRKLLQVFRRRPQHPALLVIRTSLDTPRCTVVELSDNPGILLQLSTIASPNHMFGPNRAPFERSKVIFAPGNVRWS